MSLSFRLLLLVFLAAAPAHGAAPPPPPAEPASPPSGILRLAGNPEMAGVVRRWSTGFRGGHPAVRVRAHLTGSDTGMAALYTGKADIALLGREPTASEIQAFEWIYHEPPAQAEIMTGSLDHPGKSPALVVFVHRDNPLARITLAQLRAIFGAERRLSPATLHTWSELGLTGEWAARPIRLYAPDAMSGTGRFFRRAVLHDRRMMNWAQLTEFRDTSLAGAAAHDAGRKIIAALAPDRYGLAIGSLGFARPGVRPVALAAKEGSPAVAPTREALGTRRYPLTRIALACYRRKSAPVPDSAARDFLRYILSAAGQEEVARDDGYLPLPAEVAREQRTKLD